MTGKEMHEMTGQELKAHVAAGGDLAELVPHMTRGEPYDGPPIDPQTVPMVLKSIRLPVSMVEWLMAQNHPDGVSGVVRYAVERLQAGSRTVPLAEAEKALEILSRAIHEREAA